MVWRSRELKTRDKDRLLCRSRHFAAHILFIGITAGAGLFHRNKSIAADMNKAIRRDQQANNQRPLLFEQFRRQRYARHDWNIGGLYATVGEMCDALRDVWGEYEEVPLI